MSEATREYKLTMNAPLPQQQVVLSVMKNKVHLIDLICEELQQLDDVPLNTSLVIKERTGLKIGQKARSQLAPRYFFLGANIEI